MASHFGAAACRQRTGSRALEEMPDPMIMSGYYDPILVALSIAVAIFASFTALNLAGRLLAADNRARFWWLSAASVALGGGIWSMHFVGMLAFVMPMPATYDVQLTLVS